LIGGAASGEATRGVERRLTVTITGISSLRFFAADLFINSCAADLSASIACSNASASASAFRFNRTARRLIEFETGSEVDPTLSALTGTSAVGAEAGVRATRVATEGVLGLDLGDTGVFLAPLSTRFGVAEVEALNFSRTAASLGAAVATETVGVPRTIGMIGVAGSLGMTGAADRAEGVVIEVIGATGTIGMIGVAGSLGMTGAVDRAEGVVIEVIGATGTIGMIGVAGSLGMTGAVDRVEGVVAIGGSTIISSSTAGKITVELADGTRRQE
jgi:hypothetical protein